MGTLAPDRIILFGSRAWGEPDPDSDADLLVIVARSDSTAHQRGVRALRSLRGLGVAADVPVRTWDEFALFREVPASLEHKIATKGKVLYEQSQAATRSDLAR